MGVGQSIGLGMLEWGQQLVGADIAANRQQRMNKELQEQQHKFNEESAENADKRTRALYTDFLSPEARIRQYKEAGLNPALMYSGGATAGGGIGATGAQATTGGANGASLADTRGMDIAGIMQATASAENLKADAELKREEAKRLRGENPLGASEINLNDWKAEGEKQKAEKTKLEKKLVKAQTAIANAEAWVKEEGKEYALENLQYDAWGTREAFRSTKVKANVDEATEKYLTEREAMINKQYFLTAMKIEAETNLTEAQIEAAWVGIQELIRSNDIKQLIADRNYEVALKEIKAKLGAAGIAAGGSLLNTIIEIAAEFIPGAKILKKVIYH